jgi:hypothetical protein
VTHATSIQVDCPDPDARNRIQRWLERSRLQPSIPVTLRIRRGIPPSTPDSRPIFAQPAVHIQAGPPSHDVRITWRIEPAVAVLPAGATYADVTLSDAALKRFDDCVDTFLITVLILLLRRVGWHHVHAAAVIDPEGRGWLLAGNARAGKSTTAALLASHGWAVGTDDTSFLVADGDCVQVVAPRYPLALREGGHALLGRPRGIPLHRRKKTGCWPEDLGGRWTPRVTPQILLFTTVGDRETTTAPLRGSEALAHLVRWSAWVILEANLAQSHLELLKRLSAQTTSYQVMLGSDVFTNLDPMTSLIHD